MEDEMESRETWGVGGRHGAVFRGDILRYKKHAARIARRETAKEGARVGGEDG